MTTNPSFKKTATQKDAVKQIANSSAKDFCLYGSSRSGKSFLIMRMILIRAAKVERSDHIIARETFASAKASIWQKTLPDVLRICFPNLNGKFNNSDYIYTLPNQSTIKIAGLDDAKKIERLLGTEYSTLWLNESNQVSYPAVNKLKTRLAQKNALKKVSYYDLNPTKTSSWVYQLFEQKVNPSDGEMIPNPEDFLSIRMNIEGNLENVDPDYLKLLQSMPEAERKRFLLGEYDDSNNGSAVYAFNEADHVDECAKKLPGTVYAGVDFNIHYNSDVLISNHAHGIYVWGEQQIAGDTFKKCDGLKRMGATGATVICDSTGKAQRTSGMSDHEILKQAGFNVVYKTNPAVKDKIANLNRAFTLGLIKIHPSCRKLLRDIKQLEWNSKGKFDEGKIGDLGHLVDGLAYAVWYLYPLKDVSNYKIMTQS